MGKYIAGAVALIIVLGGGYYLLVVKKGTSMPQGGGTTVAMGTATTTYQGATFSVVYPVDYTVDAAYTYDQVNPKKPISAVKFTIPSSMATGTNLAADSYMSVEWLPRAKTCSGDIYLAANVHPRTITESNGVAYSVATSSDAAAGNRYDESVYALSGSSPCTAVRYFIHYSAIENYPAGTVQQFDEQALMSAFDTIRQSLVLNSGSAPVMAPTTVPAPTTNP